MSSTSTTRRSRSGCQVRTTTVRVRAVARQSIERVSSPRTNSRSESNSVPRPRTRTAARPSSSRSRASREGRWRRDSKAGRLLTAPGTSVVRCRAVRPSGPGQRTVTPVARRSPRRRGCRGVVRTARSPGDSEIRWRLPVAPAVGCHASRSSARTRRSPPASTTRVVAVSSPRRTGPVGRRTTWTRVGAGATNQSTATSTSTASSHNHAVDQAGRSTTGTIPSRSSSGTRPVRAISAAPGPSPSPSAGRWCCRRPRARPRAAARSGGRGWRTPATSRRRG